jgi:PAS domain-containing protein
LGYLEKGQIEIIPYTHWYVIEGAFDSDRVLNGWVEKLNQALVNGYDGLRLTENTFWLEKEDWNDFVDYEEEVDRVLGNYQMIALCTYCLDRCNTKEIIDVVANHQFALIKRDGKWEQIESSKRKKAEDALKRNEQRLNDILSSIQDGFFELDQEWRFTYINRRASHNVVFEPEELIGECIWEKFGWTVNSEYERVFKQVMGTRLSVIFEIKNSKQDKMV